MEHMDGQSYYNLMSDLSHMNVLSGYDIVGQYAKVPPAFMVERTSSKKLDFSWVPDEAVVECNFFDHMQQMHADLPDRLKWMESTEGQSANAVNYFECRQYLQRENALYGKLFEIFDFLK